jgi:hypothetical protein
MTDLPAGPVAGHAIRRVTADLTMDSRAYLVAIVCECGREYPAVTVADFSGVLDVAMQVFLAHLAVLALPSTE